MQQPSSASPSRASDRRTPLFWRKRPSDGATTANGVESLLGPNMQIYGDVSFTGGLRIDGRVTGDVVVTGEQAGTLTIGEQGYVEGNIRVSKLVVYGQINGHVQVTGLVDMRESALIRGDLQYGSLEMVAGAVIHGKLIRHQGQQPL
jgi:cytoskeletal protein CcmA (bactofilin family)